MALEGVVGIGITKRPTQQCLDAVENAARRAEAEEGTVEQNSTPWIARKKVTALAICLVALPVLMTTVSRRDAPWTPASFWPLATFARQGNVVTHALFIYLILRRRVTWCWIF
jgi:xyloglucan fucosyltransferase